MKTFMGIPGEPPIVTVVGDGQARPLGSMSGVGPWGWGKGSLGAGPLARAILLEHTGSEDQAARYHRRFMWRTVATWDAAKPWTLTTPEIDAALAEIRDVEADKRTTAQRAAVGNERPPMVNDAMLQADGSVSAPKVKA